MKKNKPSKLKSSRKKVTIKEFIDEFINTLNKFQEEHFFPKKKN